MLELKAHIQPASANCRDRAAWMLRGNRLIVAVADGADSNADSGYAAEYAIKAVMQAVGNEAEPLSAGQWAKLVTEIDVPLSLEPSGETALLVADIGGGRINGASVGDCAAWLIGDGVTDLTSKQRRKPLLGSAGAQAVGFSGAGDLVLMATDGLHRFAAREKLVAGAHNFDPEALLALARLPSGKWYDDATAVLVRKAAVQTITQQGRINWVN